MDLPQMVKVLIVFKIVNKWTDLKKTQSDSIDFQTFQTTLWIKQWLETKTLFTHNTNLCIQSNQGADLTIFLTQSSNIKIKIVTNLTLSIHFIALSQVMFQIQIREKEVEKDQDREQKNNKKEI